MKKLHSFIWINDLTFQLGVSALALAAFILPFKLPQTALLKIISVLVRYNNTRLLPVLVILLLLFLMVRKERISVGLTALVVFPACALALLGFWASVYTESNVIAGILPRIDALSFYTSSMSLLEKGHLIGYTQRRPLFSGFFAFLLWLSGRDMQVAIAMLAFLSALALYFAVLEVRRAFNPLAAVIFFIPQFLYYRMYIGNIMSETLGFLLGMLAFMMFLRALRTSAEKPKERTVLFSAAVFIFTLSQLARPGAIVTVPLLILFAGWKLHAGGKFNWRVPGLAAAAVLVAYLLNSFLFNQLTLPGADPFSNAANGLYGVVAGGRSWNQIHVDYPEINSLSAGLREQRIVQVILKELITRPQNFIRGMSTLLYFALCLIPVYNYNIYAYMLTQNYVLDSVLIGIYYLFSIAGIIFLIGRRREALSGFILFLFAGFLLSLPFSPPYQSQFMRYYPATIPLLGILPAAGVFWLTSRLPHKRPFTALFKPAGNDRLPHLAIACALIPVCAVLVGPLLVQAQAPQRSAPDLACKPGETLAVLPYYSGSGVSVEVVTKTWLPMISYEDFRRQAWNIPDVGMKNYFGLLPVPLFIYPSLDLLTDTELYVAVKDSMLPAKDTIYYACGKMEALLPESSDFGFFHARLIRAQ